MKNLPLYFRVALGAPGAFLPVNDAPVNAFDIFDATGEY
jgi:hypothetical protein